MRKKKAAAQKTEEVTVTTAYFRVTGEALTEIARNILLDDEPGQALRLLTNALIGDGALEAAHRILRGECELVGDSSTGLDLVDAQACPELAAFKQSLRHLYAGRIKRRGVWRRPVAWLEQLGEVDAHWAAEQAGEVGSKAWHRWRARFYVGNNGEAEALELPGHGNVWVLFEACGERPYWDNPPLDAQAALDEALACGRKLELKPVATYDKTNYDYQTPFERARRTGALRVIEDEGEREREEQEDREEAIKQAEWNAKLDQIGRDVRERAGSDTFELALTDGRTLTIPRAPFVRWALCRTDLRDTAPAWDNVATSGLKMPLDNPDHTDWVLGAGLTFEQAYADVVSTPAWELAFELQEQAREANKPKRKFAGIFAAIDELHHARHQAAVIVDGGECTGVVGTDIVVLPNSGSEHVEAVSTCKGVIVEQGGPLAHLIIVARGQKITVMRHPDACEVFKTGMNVALSPASGRITVIDE